MSSLRRASPALVVSILAAVLVVGGTAYASQRYLITSTRQIAPKVLRSLRGRTGPRGRRGFRGFAGPPGATGPTGPQGPGAVSLFFSGPYSEGAPTITKTFVVDGYTYTNRCGLNSMGPTDSVTVTGPSFDVFWVSETMENDASNLGSPSYAEQTQTTSVTLADATGTDDSNNVVVVSPAELTNRATGETQTISLIARSIKLTSAIYCELSGTVTPGG